MIRKITESVRHAEAAIDHAIVSHGIPKPQVRTRHIPQAGLHSPGVHASPRCQCPILHLPTCSRACSISLSHHEASIISENVQVSENRMNGDAAITIVFVAN